MDEMPALWSPDDVARWLSWSPRRVERAGRAGQIPCRVLPDGSLVFDPGELRDWLHTLPRGEEARHG